MIFNRFCSRMAYAIPRAVHVCSFPGQFLSVFLYLMMGLSLLFDSITPNCQGFRFLGTTVLIVGCLSLFLICCSFEYEEDSPHLVRTKDLLCYVPIYLVMVVLVIFALTVSSRGGGKSPPGRTYKEYDLTSYSEWMQNKINDTHNWDKYYKIALIKNNVCSKFAGEYTLDTLDEFYNRDLSPFESGCCMPREECNFNYTSPLTWTKSVNQSYSNMDCYVWDNAFNTRCFNCQSCKASFAQDLTTQWFWKSIFLIILLGLQFVVFVAALCVMAFDSTFDDYALL